MTAETLTIYHNPSCSKSRETLQILKQHKTQPYVIEYLDTPPSKGEISQIIDKLGVAPIDLLRTTEKAYIEAKYQADLMSDEEIIEAIAKHPSLLQRPIVIYGNKAIIGRPPIKVLDIIPY
jgi:arsenate reductase